MTDQLKQLSEAATQGEWAVNPRATFSVEAPERRGICSTGGYSDNRRDGEELFAENVANAAFIAALVQAYRAGELIPASEARAQVAVAYEVAAEEVMFICIGDLDKPAGAKDPMVVYDAIRALTPDHTTSALEQIRQQARDEEREAMNHVAETLKEAVHSYNEWMLDDDYNAGPVLDRTISHIKSALATLSTDTQG